MGDRFDIEQLDLFRDAEWIEKGRFEAIHRRQLPRVSNPQQPTTMRLATPPPLAGRCRARRLARGGGGQQKAADRVLKPRDGKELLNAALETRRGC